MERLVKGRERIYLDRFWNEPSANLKAIGEATRRHYARLYARPGAMHWAFNQFAALTQDAADNKTFAAKGKLTMPILALGGDHSFGMQMTDHAFGGYRCNRWSHYQIGSLGDGRTTKADDYGNCRFH